MTFIAMVLTLAPTKGPLGEHDIPLEEVAHLLSQKTGTQSLPGPQVSLTYLGKREHCEEARLVFFGPHADDHMQLFTQLLASHPYLSVHQQSKQIQAINLTQPPWAGVCSWADITSPSTETQLQLHFLSPMSLHHHATHIPAMASFPDALTVFSQLLHQWTNAEGPPLPNNLLPFLHQQGCIVADYHLHTTLFLAHPGASRKGYIGWVRYECREHDPLCVTALQSLARFACFAGTGFYVEQGMGTTLLQKTEENTCACTGW